jgi:hypothetical protein
MKLHQAMQRRGFLQSAGFVSAGALTTVAAQTLTQPQQANGQTTPENTWPLPFVELDPELAYERGYEAFLQGACCYGTVQGILSQWQEMYGGQFSAIPADMFKYGEGGIAGWGSACGTLIGSSAMINLVCDMESARKLINELVAWYSDTALPVYVPAGKEPIAKSVSNSPLCHASVSKWCQEAQAGAVSAERKERCGRLVADVSSKTCSLLNEHFNGTFTAKNGVSETTTQCMACHGSSAMNTTLGKMECSPCHPSSLHPAPVSNWKKL